MKRAAIIHYTDRGAQTAAQIADALKEDYEIAQYCAKCRLEEVFSHVDALIYVGACGIAVRAIAPYLKSKTTDPAVIVTDERGLNVISLISGHIGGANALARTIAAAIGGHPVITTATDVNDRFAVDEWAKRQNLTIDSMLSAKKFAMEILKRDLPMQCDFPIVGALPGGVFRGNDGDCGLLISCRDSQPFSMTLRLIPKILHLGIGCRRGTSAETIEAAVAHVLETENLQRAAVQAVASIDVKQNEEGLLNFCEKNHWRSTFYSAETLRNVRGEFTASTFVQSTVGVDNVCERAAMQDVGEHGTLIVKKTCLNGVTVAVAQEDWSVRFE